MAKDVLLPIAKRESPTAEIGAAGLKESGGLVLEEFVLELRGQQGAQRYREMADNCPCVDAALSVLKNTAKRAIQDGKVEPCKDKPQREDEERAKYVDECFEDMAHSRSDMDDEALTMCEYGYAPLELVYKRRAGYKRNEEQSSRFDDGGVGWSKVVLRAQESVWRWQFDGVESGELEMGRSITAMVQIPAPSYREFVIPIDRLALFRTTKIKNNPEGRSLLRGAYFAWKFFKRGTTVAWVGAERDVTGIPVLRGPSELFQGTVTTEQSASLARLKQIGENVRNDEQSCVVLPSDVDPETKAPLYGFELLSSPGTKTMDVPAMTKDQERQILMVLFSDFLLLGHEKIGTQALFGSRMNLYAMQLDALLDRYDEVVNRQMIPRLALFNGWPMDRLPYFKHGRVSEAAMGEMGAFLQQYTAAGGMLDPDLDAYVREQVGWPAMSPEALEIMTQPKPQAERAEPEPDVDDVDEGGDVADEPEVEKGAVKVRKADQVKALLHMMTQTNSGLQALAEVQKMLAEAKPDPPVVNVQTAAPVINVETAAPVINVTAAEQPAPKVFVAPAQVNVAAAQVTVPPVQVVVTEKQGPQEMAIVSMPARVSHTKADVKRDGFGHILETETQTMERDGDHG